LFALHASSSFQDMRVRLADECAHFSPAFRLCSRRFGDLLADQFEGRLTFAFGSLFFVVLPVVGVD
jgi:hypothetical protein